jgi:endonuclease/exonuclease/phosphatase family metal-dependent hydrolase
MPSLTVLTFNVHHCEGLDGEVDVERVVAAIRAASPDVVALQELDRGLPRSGGVDQPAAIAAALGIEMDFHASLERSQGEYGMAVGGLRPFTSERVPLPRLGEEEPRIAVIARFEHLTVVAAHLSTHVRVRRIQTAALGAIAAGIEGPLVVCGDFNQGRRTLGPLEAAGVPLGREGPPTLLRGLRRRAIDHVLARPPLEVTRLYTVPSEASDHLPLSARITGPF